MRHARRLGWALAIVIAGLVTIPAASAASPTVYCVGEPACVSAGGVAEGAGAAALQSALSSAGKAGTASQKVIIGAGTYSLAGGFRYSGEGALAMVGAGSGVTVLSAPAATATVFDLGASSASMVGVSVEVPAASGSVGVGMRGGTLSYATVTSAPGAQAPTGVRVGAGATVEDTLVDLRGAAAGTAVGVVASTAGAAATLRQLSLLNGGAGSAGLKVTGTGATAGALLEDSLISGVQWPIVQVAVKAGGATAVRTSYSLYEAGHNAAEVQEGGSPPPAPGEEARVAGAATFALATFGEELASPADWHPRFDSAAIDAGTPGPLTAGESPVDLEGDPRVVNGRRDVGAYEYQRRAPVVSAIASATRVFLGQRVFFNGTVSEPEPGGAVASLRWSFDGHAALVAGAKVVHVFTRTGGHTATLTATDALGITASATLRITVVRAPPRRQLAPTLGALRLAPRRFRVARTLRDVLDTRGGTRVHFTLGVAGFVKFTVQRLAVGVLRGGVCVAAQRGMAPGPRCPRLVAIPGSLASVNGHAGAHTVYFSGRMNGRALAPGSYVLVAVNRDILHAEPMVLDGREARASAPFRIIR